MFKRLFMHFRTIRFLLDYNDHLLKEIDNYKKVLRAVDDNTPYIVGGNKTKNLINDALVGDFRGLNND